MLIPPFCLSFCNNHCVNSKGHWFFIKEGVLVTVSQIFIWGQVFNSHRGWDHRISINHIVRVFIRHWRSVSLLVPMPPPKF